MRTFKINSLKRLTNIQYSIVDYSHNTVHYYIPRAFLLYTWKFSPFDHLHPYPQSLASDNHQSILRFDEFSCLDSTYIMSEVIQYFSDLFPLNIMPSGSNHAITNGRVCFFYGWMKFHCIYLPYLLYPPSTDGHSGCLYVLAIVKNAAISMGMQISFQYSVWLFNYKK